jgi:dTDP-4-dehydrorhamnose 3,5-epimerase
MEIRETSIPGCFELVAPRFEDERGAFVKTFHRDVFAAAGLETDFREQFYTTSRRGVLRGLHFQLPPADHVKLVHCLCGEVLDAVVDLRVGSPTYGRHQLFTLSAEKANLLYIPKGLAHGFHVASPQAIMCYAVSSVHSPAHDSGIRWDSAGIPWPDASPIVSKRDEGFTSLSSLASPFRYQAVTPGAKA